MICSNKFNLFWATTLPLKNSSCLYYKFGFKKYYLILHIQLSVVVQHGIQYNNTHHKDIRHK